MSTNLNAQLPSKTHFKLWEQLHRSQLNKIYDMYTEEELLSGGQADSYYAFVHKIYREYPYLIGPSVLGHSICLN